MGAKYSPLGIYTVQKGFFVDKVSICVKYGQAIFVRKRRL